MARTKSPAIRRNASDFENLKSQPNGAQRPESPVEKIVKGEAKLAGEGGDDSPGFLSLLSCVGAIYAAFLTWGFLQERITTTDYNGSRFKYPVFLNTVQSLLAACTGYIYLRVSTKHPHRPGPLPVFPSKNIVYPLLLVALTSSLASPFGYASLSHIDYITFILAKSCKLLPVMLLHTTVFRRRYPLYKYLVVFAVTLGVAVFTLHHPAEASKASKHASKAGAENRNASWGLLLLGINLLFDGLTNSTQDYIFQRFKPFGAPQMMCAMNVMSTSLTASYLMAAPYIAATPIGAYLGMGSGDELSKALTFVQKYPAVGYDVVAFGICGALGQVAIFYTVANFSSLILVTVTVTRKMMTMIVSIVMFGHSINPMQYLGVLFVFGGVGAEAYVGKREKDRAKAKGKTS